MILFPLPIIRYASLGVPRDGYIPHFFNANFRRLNQIFLSAYLKVDLGYSAAELHYGTTLALPGTMFEPTSATCTDEISYISWLRSCILYGAVHSPVTAPYRGSFKDLFQTLMTYNVDIHGRVEVVSIDRLKQVYLEDDHQVKWCDMFEHIVLQISNSAPTSIHTNTQAPVSQTASPSNTF